MAWTVSHTYSPVFSFSILLVLLQAIFCYRLFSFPYIVFNQRHFSLLSLYDITHWFYTKTLALSCCVLQLNSSSWKRSIVLLQDNNNYYSLTLLEQTRMNVHTHGESSTLSVGMAGDRSSDTDNTIAASVSVSAMWSAYSDFMALAIMFVQVLAEVLADQIIYMYASWPLTDRLLKTSSWSL